MDFQRDELFRILREKGWEIEVIDNYDFHIWSKETWHLCSLWSQVGTTAYLAFALDPMEIRFEKASVWAVYLFAELPGNGVRDKFTLPLNQWKGHLPGLLQSLEELRNPS